MATVLTTGRRNGRGVTVAAPAVVRVGVYARISSADRSNSTFTSIDAQVAACRSYVDSRASSNWIVSETFIDDGRSGKDTNRPGLSRLFDDVRAERLHVVLVHRIDRLSRSLRDLLGLVQIMEEHGVAFGSICESFDSSTPIGRATLQLVGVFAELERSTIADRTRSKIRAARRLGRWTGGTLALGFDLAPEGKRLVINEAEAHQVRTMYAEYLKLGSLIAVAESMNERGWVTKQTPTNDGRVRGGVPWSKSSVHRILSSPANIARQIVEGEAYPTEHPAIVSVEIWEETQRRLQANGGDHTRGERHHSGALLAGILKCSSCGASMTPTHCKKGPRRYFFYACSRRQKGGRSACPAPYVSAPKIEAEYVARIASLAGDPRLVEAVCAAATEQLAEKKRAVTDELRALNRAIKDCERERERVAGDDAAVARLDERLRENRSRLEAVQFERAALDGVTIDASEIAALLAGSFDQVWTAMTSRERRKVVELLAAGVVARPPRVLISRRDSCP